jgi:NADH:ubiquinone oxidoreductase subunit 6 (subunit J)
MTAPLILIAFVTLGTAVAAMCRANLLHSVLLLAASWAGVAAFYLWAGAEFAAFAQMLVYIGAISMAVLFAVLLTRRSREDASVRPDMRGRTICAVLAGIAVAAVLLSAVARAHLAAARGPRPSVSVRQLGVELMTGHAAELLAVGVLLTVALIGALMLAAGDGPGKPEDLP